MTKAAESRPTVARNSTFQEHNALLDDPEGLRRQMAADGFLFFRGLLPADEIVALRRQIVQVCDKYGWIAPGTELMDGIADPSAEGMEPFCGVGVPPDAYGDVQRLESFHRLAHHPNLVAMLALLFDETVLVHALKIARLMIPAKVNAPTPAHQDHIFIQGTKTVYTCWMPLGDCPRALGGLSVLRGSHNLGILPVRAAEGAGGRHVILNDVDQDWVETDFRAGDVLVFHSLTVHKSIPNLTQDRIRLSVDFRYQPPSLPIEKKSLIPHCNVLPWEEIYAGWQSTELQYYWRDYELDFQEYDASLLEVQPSKDL